MPLTNYLIRNKLTMKLINYSAEGERASAGTKHYDNVASSMLGGFIIVRNFPRMEFNQI